MPLKLCTKCVTPETHETINFDENGVCSICRNVAYKQEQIDWEAKRTEFRALVESHRNKGQYDCIIPFSGGKDSTWTLYRLMTEYKVRPLVVMFDHGFMRPGVSENALRAFRSLGVDVHRFTPNWKVVQRTMLEALKRKGDFCWHCHTGIFAYPMQVAVMTKTPLVIWGEPSAEYTSYYGYDEQEEVDEKRFNRFVNLGITAEDMQGMLGTGIDLRDLMPFQYPALRDLRQLKARSVCLGSYEPWDVKMQFDVIQRELGWQGDQVEGVPPGYDYEKIECFMQGVRDYIKYLKRGYSRVSHLTSIDIRNGRLDRATALQMVQEYEGKKPQSLAVFLEYLGITEKEFNDIVLEHVISPWQPSDPSFIPLGKVLHDFDRIYREHATP